MLNINKITFSLLLCLSIIFLTTNALSATLVVNKTNDTNDGICDSDCSLREAIATANSEDLIVFAQLVFNNSNSVELTNGELIIYKKIIIYGMNSSRISIKRDSFIASPARVFTVQQGGVLTLINTTVSGGSSSSGGGIQNAGTLTLINTEVTANSATSGGGIDNLGIFTATNSAINNNIAPGGGFRSEGGGVFNRGTMTLINTTISNNTAINNTAGGQGGGIYCSQGSTTNLRNVTIANNTASHEGGGMFISGGSVSLGNVIIANNISNLGVANDIFGTVNSEGYNLIENIQGDINGNTTGNIIGVDPQLDPNGLRDNGGATRTIALQPNSPAIDKGSGTIAGISTDQRGFTRPVDNPNIPNAPGGDGSDMGAFEVQGGPVISINNVSLSEGDSGTIAFNFTVSLSATSNQTVTVNYATIDGSATNPSDYQSASGQVSFASSETSKQVSILVNGDMQIESNETFTVNLSNATNGTISLSNGQGTGTILNDDIAGSFQFSSANYSVNENTGTATITVTRNGGTGSGTSVIYATQNGTATAGQDYTATSGTLNFGANETSKTFSIPITNDTIIEPNETINIGLFNPTAGGTIGTPGAAVLTIIDNDQLRPTFFDFDGDGKTDISIFRPVVGEWWYVKSSTGGNAALQFGNSSDKLVPGDFTGDGKTDIAFFRPSTGFWFILRSEDFSFFSFPFGTTGDIPTPADYDGDGKTDAAVFRPSVATWFILRSSDGGTTISSFGTSTDKPVPADYDGDGKADIAIFRPSVGEWWYSKSSTGQTAALQFGSSTDRPVPGDYTGDGKADIAFFRPSTGFWFILRSEDFSFFSFPFGANGDIPTPGDYDGDGKFDSAVFRPSNSTWFLNQTTSGVGIVTFGVSGDQPVPNAFVP